MKHWIYIEAQPIPPDEGNLSFAHCEVDAEDESEAYWLGFLKMRQEPPDPLLGHPSAGPILNDYVIEVPA